MCADACEMSHELKRQVPEQELLGHLRVLGQNTSFAHLISSNTGSVSIPEDLLGSRVKGLLRTSDASQH